MNTVPSLYLAPMQDVSVLPLWRCLERRGGPDVYVTEYFRVHRDSHPEREIVRSIVELDTDKPVLAQMIGRDLEHLVRMAGLLQELTPCAGIDLNLGCPAPKVCGKQAGGALLLQRDWIRCVVEALRPVVKGTLTLKTRIGFHGPEEFDDLLELFASLPIDGLTVHGRTVGERYQSDVHTDRIADAVRRLDVPVVANGSVVCVDTALAMGSKTGATGLMIGRGGVRNPWIFQQIRQKQVGKTPVEPTHREVGEFIFELVEEIRRAGDFSHERHVVDRVKKFTNYITAGVADGELTAALRRATDLREFRAWCDRYLDSDEPYPAQPVEDGRLFCGSASLLRDAPFA